MLALAAAVAGFLPLNAQKKPPASPHPPEINQVELADYLRYVNLWPKEVSVQFEKATPSKLLPGFFDLPVKVSAGHTAITQMYLLAPDGKHLIRAQAGDRLGKIVFPVDGYPFAAEQARLKLDGRPSVGPADAPVTVAVFSDFQCGFCREEAKILRSNLISAYPGKVRLVFLDFPLTQIHDWSQQAAVAGRCVAAQGVEKFWAYHDWVFEEQPAISAMNFNGKFLEWSGKNGLDALQLGRCQQDPSVNAAVTASFQDALDLGLTSTPTLFINGRQIGGKLEWQALKQVIDMELDYVAAAKKKQEECCSVSLPGIFKQ
ncbi:MAG: thioredoxin domain-containing protein [Bryobacterales bacterium]|nr:thioredoxin domain-containing protein [Bryobacterales bacterium]